MELAGITLDREALVMQVNAWYRELTTLKDEIAKLGIADPSSARQVARWLDGELERLDAINATNVALTCHARPAAAYRRRRDICGGSPTKCQPPPCW